MKADKFEWPAKKMRSNSIPELLSELAEQRDSLLNALKLAEKAMQNNYQGNMTKAFKIVRSAIAKAETQ